MDPRWQRPHPSELSPLHQLWILPKMHVCPCFLLAPVFVGLEKSNTRASVWSGYVLGINLRCASMPRSEGPWVAYNTAIPCRPSCGALVRHAAMQALLLVAEHDGPTMFAPDRRDASAAKA